jgi:hypothetical protein
MDDSIVLPSIENWIEHAEFRDKWYHLSRNQVPVHVAYIWETLYVAMQHINPLYAQVMQIDSFLTTTKKDISILFHVLCKYTSRNIYY